jgi:putative hydrolase of the HAD superfamily
VKQPRFFYFDMGRVLVQFDHGRMLRQIESVSGVDTERLRAILFGNGLMQPFEAGQLDDRAFYDAFCEASGARPDFEALRWAIADMFTLNVPVLPLVAQLCQAGYPMGILSNTCEWHWVQCSRQFRIVGEGFSRHAFSCRLKAMKPHAEIYRAAADLAGFRPEEVFFVDDLAENVEGALAAGVDAVQFTSAAQLAHDLRQRGVRFNY